MRNDDKSIHRGLKKYGLSLALTSLVPIVFFRYFVFYTTALVLILVLTKVKLAIRRRRLLLQVDRGGALLLFRLSEWDGWINAAITLYLFIAVCALGMVLNLNS